MMQLKTYQETCIHALRDFFSALKDDAGHSRPPSAAWKAVSGSTKEYQTLDDARGYSVPFVCVQVPTGGGKTLLAAHTVDIAKEFVTPTNTGLVLWIVPTNQIYSQTLKALNTRDHPYRQVLDRASAGKTKIIEKEDKFTPSDVEENLVVLLMMMQSTSRQSKEFLRMYQSSGFAKFFPKEDRLDQHELLIEKYKLEYDRMFSQRQIKDSLGNVIRLLRPVIILDESHRAKSDLQVRTLAGFNPSAIVEFTATPHKSSNVLVRITGKQLLAEDMVKLPINVQNVEHVEWRDTLLAARKQLDHLKELAQKYESRTGKYIRPICLIQVERTGKDQQGKDFIHSEQVKAELRKLDVAENEIAIQSSEKKELSVFEDANGLLTKNNHVRYIITKEALKEGWDCSFAYVLCLLNNPKSKTGATQLVGRIMRQPDARKTGVPELDQSFVVSFRRNGVIQEIKEGFEREGITGIDNQIRNLSASAKKDVLKTDYLIRDEYERAMKHFIMPAFVTITKTGARQVDYLADIESRINWLSVDISKFVTGFQLSAIPPESTQDKLTLSNDEDLIYVSQSGEIVNTFQEATPEYLASDIIHIVPNPWQAYELAKNVLTMLKGKLENASSPDELIRYNLYKISEELRTALYNEREKMAKQIFLELLQSEEIRFVFFTDSWRPPQLKSAPADEPPFVHRVAAPPVVKKQWEHMQQSLFDGESIKESDFDTKLEKDVALWLDSQEKLFFWYRNLTGRGGYFLQGWRPHKIYPDFISTSRKPDGSYGIDKVYVIETKGDQFGEQKEESRHDRTGYTKFLFKLCNEARPKHLSELGFEMNSKPITFQLVQQEQWEQELMKLMS